MLCRLGGVGEGEERHGTHETEIRVLSPKGQKAPRLLGMESVGQVTEGNKLRSQVG